jgi:hypothetical protein
MADFDASTQEKKRERESDDEGGTKRLKEEEHYENEVTLNSSNEPALDAQEGAGDAPVQAYTESVSENAAPTENAQVSNVCKRKNYNFIS